MTTVAEKKRSSQELRWSVRRKTDAVMRLLRGEDLDTVARELRVEAHRLAAWRDEFMAGGAEALKARPTDPTDRKLRDAERQIGRLTMELEVWQAAGRKRGLQIPPRRRPRLAPQPAFHWPPCAGSLRPHARPSTPAGDPAAGTPSSAVRAPR